MLRGDFPELTLNEQEVARLARARPQMPLVNAVVAFLLQSPLHGLVSHSVMLISVAGRKTGRTITTPVNYVALNDGRLNVISQRNRTWWRNLNGGAHVSLWLRGQAQSGFGTTIRNPRAVAQALTELVLAARSCAAPLRIRWNDDGTPNRRDLVRAAQHHVVVSIHLNAPGAV